CTSQHGLHPRSTLFPYTTLFRSVIRDYCQGWVHRECLSCCASGIEEVGVSEPESFYVIYYPICWRMQAEAVGLNGRGSDSFWPGRRVSRNRADRGQRAIV